MPYTAQSVLHCWVNDCEATDAVSVTIPHPSFPTVDPEVCLCPAHLEEGRKQLAEIGRFYLPGLVIPDDPKTYWPERAGEFG